MYEDNVEDGVVINYWCVEFGGGWGVWVGLVGD